MDRFREKRKRIYTMYKSGKTRAEIAKELGTSYSIISECIDIERHLEERAHEYGEETERIFSNLSRRTFYALVRAEIDSLEKIDEILQGKREKPRGIGNYGLKEIADAIKEVNEQ